MRINADRWMDEAMEVLRDHQRIAFNGRLMSRCWLLALIDKFTIGYVLTP